MNTHTFCKISYTIAEACQATGLGRTKLYELIDQGRLERRKIGRRTLITGDSLERLIADADDC